MPSRPRPTPASPRPHRPHLAEGRSGALYGGRRRPPWRARRRPPRRFRRRGTGGARLLVLGLLLVLGGCAAVALAGDRGDEPPAPPAGTTSTAAVPEPSPEPTQAANGPPDLPPRGAGQRIRWRRSVAVGLPYRGRLVRGVQLPAEGDDFFTWDPIRKASPSRGWRRWGTDRLVRTILRVAAEHRAAHPDAPRVGIGDLSRPRGGVFDRRFGGLGHASHQNGLDVDVYYPRRDRRERRPFRVSQADLRLAQDLVDRFVRAGATHVFVGPRTPLRGPRRIVTPLVHHDDHLHVRLRPPRR